MNAQSVKPGLLAAFRQVAVVNTPQRRALCKATVSCYTTWLKLFHRCVRKGAEAWTGLDVQRFLWWMHEERYSPVSRKQALCALIYVFKHVLGRDVGKLNLPSFPREKQGHKIIPERQQIAQIFAGMHGMTQLVARLLYGAGLRIGECCMLRVKDIDFANGKITVYGGKGDKDRRVLLPRGLVEPLRLHVEWRAALHAQDLSVGAGYVEMPGRLAVKYPARQRELHWQYLFPSSVVTAQRRWYLTPEAVQKGMRLGKNA